MYGGERTYAKWEIAKLVTQMADGNPVFRDNSICVHFWVDFIVYMLINNKNIPWSENNLFYHKDTSELVNEDVSPSMLSIWI